jgi:hypothetical protein
MTPCGLELAARLERLLELPLTNSSDVEPWILACAKVQSWLYTHSDKLPFEMPSLLMFFFHDPDIRVRDPDYKQAQEQQIHRLIRQLRGEELLDIRRPWWRFW